jgi:hypothetical protein
MNAAGGRGRIVYINPNSSTLPILHPEQAPEIFSWMKEEGMFTSSWTTKFFYTPFHPRAGFGLVRAPYISRPQLLIQHLAPAWGRSYTFRRSKRQGERGLPDRAEEEQAIVWDFARPDSKQIIHWRRQSPCAAVFFTCLVRTFLLVIVKTKKAKQSETNIIVSQLSKICHWYTYLCLFIDTLWLIMMFNI